MLPEITSPTLGLFSCKTNKTTATHNSMRRGRFPSTIIVCLCQIPAHICIRKTDVSLTRQYILLTSISAVLLTRTLLQQKQISSAFSAYANDRLSSKKSMGCSQRRYRSWFSHDSLFSACSDLTLQAALKAIFNSIFMHLYYNKASCLSISFT